MEDAVEGADLYAVRVRREFEKPATPGSRNSLAHDTSQGSARATVGSLEEIDGVLIHPVEGATRLVLSDEFLQISSTAEMEMVTVGPINLFHVQSRAPWVQRVCPAAA